MTVSCVKNLWQIVLVQDVMDSLNMSIWCFHYLCKRTKIQIFRSVVFPLLCYGHKTQSLNGDLKSIFMHLAIKTWADSWVIAGMTVSNWQLPCGTELSALSMNANSGCIGVQLATQWALHCVVSVKDNLVWKRPRDTYIVHGLSQLMDPAVSYMGWESVLHEDLLKWKNPWKGHHRMVELTHPLVCALIDWLTKWVMWNFFCGIFVFHCIKLPTLKTKYAEMTLLVVGVHCINIFDVLQVWIS